MTIVLKAELPAEERKCRDKAQYHTRKLAKRASKRVPGVTLHVYKCPHCNFYHLTRNANDQKWNGKLAPKSHGPNGGV